MTQGAVKFAPPLRERPLAELLDALGLDRDDLDPRCPPQIVSTGHSKVLVGLKAVDAVDQLKPDLAALQCLSIALGCNGYFAFALTPESSALAYDRMFAPAIGINEDPVTGNANGPLGAYLVEHQLVDAIDDRFEFTARQGDVLGRPGSMRVTVTVRTRIRLQSPSPAAPSSSSQPNSSSSRNRERQEGVGRPGTPACDAPVVRGEWARLDLVQRAKATTKRRGL